MKPGHIDQFAHFSEFDSVKQFNESMKQVRKLYEHHFTKGERIALLTLIQHSVKTVGICNARICKLVQAAQVKHGPISRSTFERMLKKAKSLGIISIHHTIRQKGGYSHNVYIFRCFDGATAEKLTERNKGETPVPASPKPQESATKAPLLETKKHKHQNPRPITLESLDHTFVPSYVPTSFVKVTKPFFPLAKDICALWDRVQIAYRSLRFSQEIDQILPVIIQAFKETVYRYKQNYIKTRFIQYFYGTVAGKLAMEKQRIVSEERPWGQWLVR